MKRVFTQSLRLGLLVMLFTIVLSACGSPTTTGSSNSPVTVHLGYFPNLTHAVAIVGVARGTFQSALGSNAKLDIKTFSAGPALVEAMFANQIDIGYVGPNPAINGYVKSHGAALRIIAGSSSGGALFVVRPGANIKSAADLAGKKLATPQLGGTQDVALRYYLQQHGLKTTDKGGNVQIVPTDPANILTLFKEGSIDGAWVAEPWGTRLLDEGKGQLYLDERTQWPNEKFVTTNVIVRKQFLDQYPDLVNKFLGAHVATVQYITSNPDSAKSIVNSEIKRITGKSLTSQEISDAFTKLDITYDPLASSLMTSADRAYMLGFLGTSKPDLSGIYDLGPLNQVLTSKGLAVVTGP
jgi:NitT/TauT family transport system substrate-binding protein